MSHCHGVTLGLRLFSGSSWPWFWGRGWGEPPTGVREMVLLSFWMSFTHAGLLSRMAGVLGKVP